MRNGGRSLGENEKIKGRACGQKESWIFRGENKRNTVRVRQQHRELTEEGAPLRGAPDKISEGEAMGARSPLVFIHNQVHNQPQQ